MTQPLPQFSYKGITYTFVDCQKQFLEELKCPICLEPVSDPVQTSCGHLFCGKCIKRTDTCPVDCMNFTKTPDSFNNNQMRSFKVKCPNSEKGCDWQGYLGDAEDHTNKTCPFQLLKCTNGCEKEMERRRLSSHEMTECLHRDYKCPLCPYRGTYSTVTTSHLMVCDSFCLPCVAGCKQNLTRGEMKNHLANACTEELMECPHKMAGCASIVKRKYLEGHASDKDHHFAMLMQSCTSAMQQLYGIMQRGISPSISSIPLAFRPWLQNTPTCYPRPPWVIKMEDFQTRKAKDGEWCGEPVYSHFGGYRMCLKVYANGDRDGKGTHVSVYIYLMRGDNDDNLKWPFKGTIKISLLNQLEDRQHRTLEPWSPDLDIPEKACGRVTKGELAEGGRGYHQFICHQDLGYRRSKRRQFLKEDTIFLRVDCFDPALDL